MCLKFREPTFAASQLHLIMKKQTILFLLISFIYVSFSNAQAPLKVGSSQLNAGLGFSGWGIPIYIGFDYGFKKDITLGGELSFRSYGNDYNKKNYRHTIIGIGVNGNYHFNSVLEIPKQWDLYAGLNVGFYFWNSSSDYRGDGASGVGLGGQVGGRYFFTPKFGINLEVGGATVSSGGKIGITYLF